MMYAQPNSTEPRIKVSVWSDGMARDQVSRRASINPPPQPISAQNTQIAAISPTNSPNVGADELNIGYFVHRCRASSTVKPSAKYAR